MLRVITPIVGTCWSDGQTCDSAMPMDECLCPKFEQYV